MKCLSFVLPCDAGNVVAQKLNEGSPLVSVCAEEMALVRCPIFIREDLAPEDISLETTGRKLTPHAMRKDEVNDLAHLEQNPPFFLSVGEDVRRSTGLALSKVLLPHRPVG